MTLFRAKMCLLGVPRFYISTHFSRKTDIVSQYLTGGRKFWLKKSFNSDNSSKLPLIVIVAL